MSFWNHYQNGLITIDEYHRLLRDSLDPNVPVDRAIQGVYRMMDRPNYNPQTSTQMRERANGLRTMATGLKIQGIDVKKEYL